MERYNEYRYRRLFQCTHEEYLDTPYEDIEWMLHVDETVTAAEAKKRAPAAVPPPVGMPVPRIS